MQLRNCSSELANWYDKAMEFTEKNSVSHFASWTEIKLNTNGKNHDEIYIQVVLIGVCVIVGKKVAVSIIMLLI